MTRRATGRDTRVTKRGGPETGRAGVASLAWLRRRHMGRRLAQCDLAIVARGAACGDTRMAKRRRLEARRTGMTNFARLCRGYMRDRLAECGLAIVA